MKILVIILLVVIIFLECVSQFLLQKKVQTNNDFYLIIGMIMYALLALAFYFLLKEGQTLSVANIIWNALALIIITLIGYFYFKQSLSTTQIIALILSLVALILAMC